MRIGIVQPGIAAAVCAMALVVAFSAQAQILHPADPLPSFEVATVKPWKRVPSPPPQDGAAAAPRRPAKVDPDSGGVAGQVSDRVHMILPAGLLIASAYNLPPGSASRIVGGPDWLADDINQYELSAKIDDAQFAAMQTMTALQQHREIEWMEQLLLAERFGLKIHFETREMPVYLLVVGKSGSRLAPAKPGEASRLSSLDTAQGSEMSAVAVTMNQFAQSPLLSAGGQLVVDRTGLAGAYDFTLKSAGQETGSEAPSFFTAIQEQLGLRLVPGKAAVEVIVIDRIEKPSAN